MGKELHKALLAAQESAKGLSKDGKNSFGKFGYTSIEEVVRTCRAMLHKQGLVFFPESQAMCVEGDLTYVSQSYVLRHVDSGEVQAITRTMVIPENSKMSPCQAQGSAESYLLKNTLRELLLLPRFDKNEDIDTHEPLDEGPRGHRTEEEPAKCAHRDSSGQSYKKRQYSRRG